MLPAESSLARVAEALRFLAGFCVVSDVIFDAFAVTCHVGRYVRTRDVSKSSVLQIREDRVFVGKASLASHGLEIPVGDGLFAEIVL